MKFELPNIQHFMLHKEEKAGEKISGHTSKNPMGLAIVNLCLTIHLPFDNFLFEYGSILVVQYH